MIWFNAPSIPRMNLKMVLLCSFYRWEDRGSSQRDGVAWPKSTQAASVSVELWTWFLWVQVQASSCHALITSSETYQIFLEHCLTGFWLSARSNARDPGEPIVWLLYEVLQTHGPGRANISVQVQTQEKASVPVWRPSFIWVRVQFFVQPIGWGPPTLGRVTCFT